MKLEFAPFLASKAALRVLDALEAGGGTARFVGGCVRNVLLGADAADVDIATDVTPDEVTRRLEAAGIAAHPTGIEHGTITAVADGETFEVTTLRRDVTTDGRRATVAFTTDWREDAARRDFTINALYADRDGTITDFFGGLDDIARRRVRFIGEADARIAEDHLRILRFFRFQARHGRGEPDAEALRACSAGAAMIGALSAERVRDEMLKILVSPDPGRVLRQMAASGVLAHAMPGPLEIERMTRVALLEDEQLFVSDALMRLGALMPDQADAREAAIQRLKLSNDEKARLRAMAGREPKIVSYLSIREVRRALYRIGVQAFKDRAMLGWAGDPKPGNAPQWRALRALAESWVRPEMDLDGHEIMAAGVPPGPEVGRVRAEVEDWWIDTDFTDDKFSIIERLKAVVQATVY